MAGVVQWMRTLNLLDSSLYPPVVQKTSYWTNVVNSLNCKCPVLIIHVAIGPSREIITSWTLHTGLLIRSIDMSKPSHPVSWDAWLAPQSGPSFSGLNPHHSLGEPSVPGRLASSPSSDVPHTCQILWLQPYNSSHPPTLESSPPPLHQTPSIHPEERAQDLSSPRRYTCSSP